MLKIKDGTIRRGSYELQGVNIDVPKNTITVLVGRNASGKSTLIDGIIGSLLFQNGTIEKEQLNIAYVGTDNPFDKRVEGMLMSSVMKEVDSTFDPQKFRYYLDEFLIPVYMNVSEMSTGQLKLFTLALGLARDTNLLILDEIDTNLDVVHKNKLEKIFADYMTVEGRSIIVSTNQLELYDDVADRVIYIKDKAVFYAGEVSELIANYTVWIGNEEEFSQLSPDDIVYYEKNQFNIKALLHKPSPKNDLKISEILLGLERSRHETIHKR
ncbi:ATP-binding cassette domain-containing protein [Erysipelothrix urinaevulpis]|uniref:ATP-binding cassette domain-containing protein n=1 Tax=Erysipelothrix urinaevulpis TaxID=2683717 RepID=UPI00135B43A4|nr:ATP-binding cassette domain-containing protein [Erysipelothrix urinaevulpis]